MTALSTFGAWTGRFVWPLAVMLLGPAALAGGPVAGYRSRRVSGRVEDSVVYRSVGGQGLALDVYMPPLNHTLHPALIVVHGGDWAGGDKRDVAAQGLRAAAEGWVAFAVNYRLAPASPFPAALDDLTVAVAWVRANAARYGVDPQRIAALGISAGGNLVGELATEHGPMTAVARIMAAVSWSGPMNLLPDPNTKEGIVGGTGIASYLGCQPPACPDIAAAASPYQRVQRDTTPMLLTNATSEIVPVEQARAMAARLAQFGVGHRLYIYSGPGHADPVKAWPVTVSWLHARFRDRHGLTPGRALAIAGGLLLVVLLVLATANRRGSRSRASS